MDNMKNEKHESGHPQPFPDRLYTEAQKSKFHKIVNLQQELLADFFRFQRRLKKEKNEKKEKKGKKENKRKEQTWKTTFEKKKRKTNAKNMKN